MITRRGILGALLAAPAIIRTPGLLMPVKAPLVVATDDMWWSVPAVFLSNMQAVQLHTLIHDASQGWLPPDAIRMTAHEAMTRGYATLVAA